MAATRCRCRAGRRRRAALFVTRPSIRCCSGFDTAHASAACSRSIISSCVGLARAFCLMRQAALSDAVCTVTRHIPVQRRPAQFVASLSAWRRVLERRDGVERFSSSTTSPTNAAHDVQRADQERDRFALPAHAACDTAATRSTHLLGVPRLFTYSTIFGSCGLSRATLYPARSGTRRSVESPSTWPNCRDLAAWRRRGCSRPTAAPYLLERSTTPSPRLSRRRMSDLSISRMSGLAPPHAIRRAARRRAAPGVEPMKRFPFFKQPRSDGLRTDLPAHGARHHGRVIRASF